MLATADGPLVLVEDVVLLLLPQALMTSAAATARILFIVRPPLAFESWIGHAYYREP